MPPSRCNARTGNVILCSRELAFGFYGSMNLYLMARLTMPDCELDRKTAVRIVQLFLKGAGK